MSALRRTKHQPVPVMVIDFHYNRRRAVPKPDKDSAP